MVNEKRLIYMDDTMDKLRAYADRKHQAGHTELANGILKAVNYIHNEISRVDAVEVVRCKDCRFYRKPFCILNDNKNGWLNHELPEHFCSHGEREKDG